jgi:hypothetical protein
MLNKKMKIIVFLIIVLFLLAILVFALKSKDKNVETEGNGKIDTKEEYSVNTGKEDGKFSKALEELKANHPEFSSEQLEFYYKIANSDEKEIFTCFDRKDERDCVASVAFIKGDKNVCYIHTHDDHDELSEDEYEESLHECVNDVLLNTATEEVDECQSFEGDIFFGCFKNLFSIYEKKDDCAILSNKEARVICEEIFDYEKAYLEYDRELCNNIKNEKLKQYCLKNIVDKLQDTDGDGLTDLEEINIYKSHYLFSDTDGDGYSDGEEVKNGFNPNGEGNLKL